MNRLMLLVVLVVLLSACSNTTKNQLEETPVVVSTQPFENGVPVQIEFKKGKEFYHPLIVFWVEDLEGNFIETVYASQSIATGTFRYGESEGKNWKPGERRRPAALPYWGHKRGEIAPDGLYLPTPQRPLPDAITGATPKSSFVLNSRLKPELEKVNLFMEINQTWDWNQFWHNNLYPDDEEYKTSCQPALVYMVELDILDRESIFELKPIGHSHPSGKTGELFPDLSTLTSALDIAQRVTIRVMALD
jgi:hypothetical protein